MKKDYLSNLRLLLNKYVMEDQEKEDIISDYSEMYDNWLDMGMTEDDVENKLGKPEAIIHELTVGYNRIPRPKKKGNKIIAIMPFIATVIFFVLGFAFDLWTFSWMAYLLIPVTAILVEMINSKDRNVFIGLTPFIALITFFILGFGYDLWHPGWLVFLIIPVTAILLNTKGLITVLTALSPFAALIVFIYLGDIGYYHPGWLVFIGIPMIGVLNDKNIGRIIIWETLFVIAIVGYLYIWSMYDSSTFGIIAFVPVVAYGILTGEIKVEVTFMKMTWPLRLLVLSTAVIYLALGLVFGLWGYGSLVFLLIPIATILTEVKGKEKFIAISPLICTILFVSLGGLFGIWEYIWMVYLAIPVTAILLGND